MSLNQSKDKHFELQKKITNIYWDDPARINDFQNGMTAGVIDLGKILLDKSKRLNLIHKERLAAQQLEMRMSE